MNRINGMIRLHLKDKFGWVWLPWAILLSSFGINLFIALLSKGQTAIYTGGLASIFIYMFFAGATVVKQTFPFALGLSLRRTDYFVGTVLGTALICGLTALAVWFLSIIEGNLIPGWGVDLHFFQLPYVNDGNLIQQLLVYFLWLFQLFFLGFVAVSFHQRFGRIGIGGLTIFLIVAVSVLSYAITYFNWWGVIFDWLGHHSAFELTMWTVPALLIYLLGSFWLLRRATV